MNNPWGVTLKKTGLNESRMSSAEKDIDELNKKQDDLKELTSSNLEKQDIYDERQGSLSASAMLGQQGRLNGQGGKYKRKSRKHKKSRKSRKHKKSRRSRTYRRH